MGLFLAADALAAGVGSRPEADLVSDLSGEDQADAAAMRRNYQRLIEQPLTDDWSWPAWGAESASIAAPPEQVAIRSEPEPTAEPSARIEIAPSTNSESPKPPAAPVPTIRAPASPPIAAPAVSGPAPGAKDAQTATGQRLVIPKAGIKADIDIAKMTALQMPQPVSYSNVLTYDMKSLNGLGGDVSKGNLVIAGHSDCARCNNGGPGPAVFWEVRNLKAGDSAQVYMADGKVVNYVVTKATSVPRGRDFRPLISSNAADMTLITCTGNFRAGDYDQRQVVHFKKRL
jgi:sortase (surface protein transpeptidase)